MKKKKKLTRGQLLRKVRLKKDLTQKGLAELAGCEQSTISEIESDKHSNYGTEMLVALCVAMKVRPEALLPLEDDWLQSKSRITPLHKRK